LPTSQCYLADRPALMHWLVGEMDRSPVKGRGIVNVLMNFGADNYGNHDRQMREPEAAIMPKQGQLPTFKQFMAEPPAAAAPREKSYGGPL